MSFIDIEVGNFFRCYMMILAETKSHSDMLFEEAISKISCWAVSSKCSEGKVSFLSTVIQIGRQLKKRNISWTSVETVGMFLLIEALGFILISFAFSFSFFLSNCWQIFVWQIPKILSFGAYVASDSNTLPFLSYLEITSYFISVVMKLVKNGYMRMNVWVDSIYH